MRMLILTQYYMPETGAAPARLHALARHLQAEHVDVTVVTAMPNYPEHSIRKEYRHRLYARETIDGVRVHRSPLVVRRSPSIAMRMITYISFCITSFFVSLITAGSVDVVICESPPLFLGVTGAALARIRRARFVLNVSDLWPESARALGIVRNRWALSVTSALERWLYRKADLVTGQTKGITQDIAARTPTTPVVWLPYGVETDSIGRSGVDGTAWRARHDIPADAFVVLYAGLFGHAQGLDVAVQAAVATRDDPRLCWVLLGDGPARPALAELASRLRVKNLRLLDAVSHAEAHEALQSADAALVPLRPLPLFRGAVPSKIFEALAASKPLLLGVEGEARDLFVDDAEAGVAYAPGDAGALARAAQSLASDRAAAAEMGARGAAYVDAHFDRREITRRLLDALA